MRRFDLPGDRHLRLLEEADAVELHALIDRNRVSLAKWMQWAPHQTPAETLEFIRAARTQVLEDNGLQTAIVEDRRILGVVGFHGIDWPNRAAGMGYWLDEAERGQGIMFDAVSALVSHAFEHWRLNRVEIRADVQNSRSRTLAERLGFHYEGLLREAYRVGDRYCDDVVYSLLAREHARAQR